MSAVSYICNREPHEEDTEGAKRVPSQGLCRFKNERLPEKAAAFRRDNESDGYRGRATLFSGF